MSRTPAPAPFTANRRAVVLGGDGMLAFELGPALRAAGWDAHLVPMRECDVTDERQVINALERHRPNVVVNCAAYTLVDKAESDPDRVFAVNATAAGTVARLAADFRARVVHVSTNAVFDGELPRPYLEDDAWRPLGVYATSKRDGEIAVRATADDAIIVRTGHLYGANGNNFIDKLISQVKASKPLRVVTDQIVSPTWTRDVSRQICRLISTSAKGTFHAMALGSVSWFDAAKRILELLGVDARVTPVTLADFASPVPRPRNGILANAALERAGVCEMRAWDVALAEYIGELRE